MRFPDPHGPHSAGQGRASGAEATGPPRGDPSLEQEQEDAGGDAQEDQQDKEGPVERPKLPEGEVQRVHDAGEPLPPSPAPITTTHC